MINISGFGLGAQVTASRTFPNGFGITAWADDADPLDSPDLELADTGMGLNGDMVVWSRPTGIEVSINVIPGSEEDINLDVLAQANRVAKGKIGARDLIGMVFNYPDGKTAICSSGVIISAPMVAPVASAGRMKTHMYKFRFEQISKSNVPPAP